MTEGERRERLELAKRRNRRRLALPEFSEGLRLALGQRPCDELRIVGLDDSFSFDVAIHNKLDELRASNSLEFMRTTSRGRLRQEAHCVFGASGETEYLVLFSHWRYMGAIRLTGEELELGLLSLLKWDGDTFYGGTPDLDSVFLFDITLEGDQEVYESNYWPANPRDAECGRA